MKKTKLVALLTLLVVTSALALPALARKNQSTPLSDDEIYWLKFMREEEKIARDVYTYLYNEWGLSIFYNIKASEQKHMDKVKGLLDKYGIADPADGKDYGEFENDYIQGLYDELTDKGDNSRVDALEVGVIIEETDIGHLGEAIDDSTHNDIINVYTNCQKLRF